MGTRYFIGIRDSAIAIVAMSASFWLLSLAMKELPLGTAYAIWTGVGAVGAFILGIIVLGLIAFSIGTGSGVIMAKVMNKFARTDAGKINPLIGSAGVSAVPMAARVSNKVGMDANPQNYLLMHAMGPNVAGVIGSAVAAGVMISLVGG